MKPSDFAPGSVFLTTGLYCLSILRCLRMRTWVLMTINFRFLLDMEMERSRKQIDNKSTWNSDSDGYLCLLESKEASENVYYSLFIEVCLIYNVLVSGVQQSDSVIHAYRSFFFRFFSLVFLYYKKLSIGPCAIVRSCCFHALAIIESAAMNIGVHVSFWIMEKREPSTLLVGM